MATAAKKKPTKKKTTSKKSPAKRKATAKKTSGARRRLRGASAIQPKAKSKSLPTITVEDSVAEALSHWCDGDVAVKAITSRFTEEKATVMAHALDQWANSYVQHKSLPSNFYVQDDDGNKFTYSMTSAVTLDENKIEALDGIGFNARELIDPKDDDSDLKWIHVAAVHLDIPASAGNERANEALENLLNVLDEEFGEEEAEKVATTEQKLNGTFFSRLMEVIDSVNIGAKATDADKIEAIVGALKPRQTPRNAKSVKSQDECIEMSLSSV